MSPKKKETIHLSAVTRPKIQTNLGACDFLPKVHGNPVDVIIAHIVLFFGFLLIYKASFLIRPLISILIGIGFLISFCMATSNGFSLRNSKPPIANRFLLFWGGCIAGGVFAFLRVIIAENETCHGQISLHLTLACIIVPASEEIFFRLYLLRRLLGQYGIISIAFMPFSMLLYKMAIHFPPSWSLISIELIPVIGIGMLLNSLLYIIARSIWPCLGAHIIYDIVVLSARGGVPEWVC
jgi:membrane protease YdiL (CAAX protease family)